MCQRRRETMVARQGSRSHTTGLCQQQCLSTMITTHNNGIAQTETCKWKSGLIDLTMGENTDPSSKQPRKMKAIDFTKELKATADQCEGLFNSTDGNLENSEWQNDKEIKNVERTWSIAGHCPSCPEGTKRHHWRRYILRHREPWCQHGSQYTEIIPLLHQDRSRQRQPQENGPLDWLCQPPPFQHSKKPLRQIFLDATFRCAPNPFYQCLILMAFFERTEVYVPIYCMYSWWARSTCVISRHSTK